MADPSSVADKYLRAASLPRATKRPPGQKFRDGLVEWVTRDLQTKLEAGGVPQQNIDSLISGLTGRYGPFLETTFSGGIGSQNYRNFPTQQDAVEWLAGRTELDRPPGGTLGHARYPDIIEAWIERYGAGNDAVRDKARGLANKLKPYQKALALMVMGVDQGSFRYNKNKYAQELDDIISRSGGEVIKQVIGFLEWAKTVSEPPSDMRW